MAKNYFGEDVAERYDDPEDEMGQAAAIDPVVDLIAGLAGEGAALEPGSAPGGSRFPCSAPRQVHGIDLSEAMVAKLRAKAAPKRVERHDR